MKIIIKKFSAPWCAQCKVVEANLKALGVEHIAIDVDKDEEAAAKYGIRNIPTIIIEDEEGNILERIAGIVSRTRLKEIIDKYE